MSPLPVLVLVAIALLATACRTDPPAGPDTRPRHALSAVDAERSWRVPPDDDSPPDELAVAAVARVEIVPSALSLIYDDPRQVRDHAFTAVAYDAAGNVLADRTVVWTDESNWNPGVTPVPVSPNAVRFPLPYASAAAHALTPAGTCLLTWKGIRATVDGVSAVAPICGTFAVTVAAEPGNFPPVIGDTITIGAAQPCRIRALATGGYGFYDYWWRLDGVEVGFGPTLFLDSGSLDSWHTLVLRVSDEGHDIAPYREMTFTLHVDGSGDAAYDC